MFAGKVVLVTGASSGIGLSTAVAFAKQDARVIITGRNKQNLQATAKLCEEVSNRKPLVIAGDLSKEDFIESLIESIIKQFDRLDVLVNNAGFGVFGSVEHCTLQQFDEIFKVNVRAVFYLTQLATPYLLKTKGNIVNVSSVVSFRALTGVVAYSMTKAALDQFTRCTALDLASRGVRVNAVNPGTIATEFLFNAGMTNREDANKFINELSKVTHPLGRAGTGEEVAEAIMFLASDKSSFTTGVTLSIDGGRHATILSEGTLEEYK